MSAIIPEVIPDGAQGTGQGQLLLASAVDCTSKVFLYAINAAHTLNHDANSFLRLSAFLSVCSFSYRPTSTPNGGLVELTGGSGYVTESFSKFKACAGGDAVGEGVACMTEDTSWCTTSLTKACDRRVRDAHHAQSQRVVDKCLH